MERKGFRPKLWRYGWDAHDRLVSCETPEGDRWTYGYDPFGRRLTKVRKLSEAELGWTATRFPHLVPAAVREATKLWTWSEAPAGATADDPRPPIVGTHFLWDGDVVAEEAPLRLDGTVEWDRATRWHYEPESFRPLAKQTADGHLLAIVTDHLGTPREMVDEQGRLAWAASYTTWGVVRGVRRAPAANDDGPGALYPRGGGSGSTRGNLALAHTPENAAADCPIRFQGQWADEESGLSYNRYRHYDAMAGQYASPDPIGLAGGYRPHQYVLNPIEAFDPFGLRTFTSSDPYVADLANAIERKFPGHVKSVNKIYRDENGQAVREFDIELADRKWIEVKSGGGKGLLKDMTAKRDYSGNRGVAYAPQAGGAVEKALNAEGFPIYRNFDELFRFADPKN